MSFFDGFQTEAEKNVGKSLSNIFDFTLEQVSQSAQLVVNKAVGPKGNLTEAQIKAGERPAIQTVNANNQGLQNSLPYPVPSMSMGKMALWGAVGVLVAFIVIKARK